MSCCGGAEAPPFPLRGEKSRLGGTTIAKALAAGRWFYLYRALDPAGATIEFLLSAIRSAAPRLFSQALADPNLLDRFVAIESLPPKLIR